MDSNQRVRAAALFVDEVTYEVTAGCDVDSDCVVVAVFNSQTGAMEVREFSQSQREAMAAANWLRTQAVECAVLESTANFHHLFYHAFRKRELNAHILNPMTIKALLAVEGKSDKADAINMARLAAHFRLRTSNMPDDTQREIRMNLRKWDADKAARTRASNSLRSLMTAYRIPIFRRVKPTSASGRNFIQIIAQAEDMSPEEVVNFAWQGPRSSKSELVELLENLNELPRYVREEVALSAAELDRLTDMIVARRRRAEDHIIHFQLEPQIGWMTTAPAVTPLLALRIIAEAGADFHARYHSAEAFCKACGLAPSNKVSAGKLLKSKKGQGNQYIKQHFVNAVKGWLISQKPHPLKTWGAQYRARAGYKRTTTALAHKIAKSLWYMGRAGGQPYSPRGPAQQPAAIAAPSHE